MTDKELADVRARADAATAGPWYWFSSSVPSSRGIFSLGGSAVLWGGGQGLQGSGEDISFVVCARDDIPDLLGYIDKLHGLLSDVERDGGIEAGRRAERARVLGLIEDMRHQGYTGVMHVADRVQKGGPADALPGDEARARVVWLMKKIREMHEASIAPGLLYEYNLVDVQKIIDEVLRE